LREPFCKKVLSNSLQKLSVLPENTPIKRGYSQELEVFEGGMGETFYRKFPPKKLRLDRAGRGGDTFIWEIRRGEKCEPRKARLHTC